MHIFYPFIWCLITWCIVQSLKVIFRVIQKGHFRWSYCLSAGGMPSAHSAIVSSLSTVVALNDGFESTTFAISFILALVVMYDAVGVRNYVGRHARIINRMQKRFTSEILTEYVGHTFFEVLVGAVLGVIIPLIFLKIL